MVRTPEQREVRRIEKERRARGEYKRSEEARAKMSKAATGKHPAEETKAKISEALSGENNPRGMLGKTHTDGAKAKVGKANRGKTRTEATKAKISTALSGKPVASRGRPRTEGAKLKQSRAMRGENNPMFGKPQTLEACKKNSESNKKSFLDKQWYGVVTYVLGRIYCVLFNAEFKERCRAYWGYKSVLEPYKTQAENICGGKPYKLTVHHVYYQKKACCGWDEDLQGYYAMINLGTERKPNMVRHNIKGDPNKFVILTASEHTATNFDKLKWIKEFESLIEEQGGKCYLTKEEMVEYKKLKPHGVI